jgi:hypothetical protein
MGNQRRITNAAGLLVLVGSSTFLPTWAFCLLALIALVGLFSSLRPTSSLRTRLTRGGALAGIVVALFVTALAAVDRFAASSDVAIVLGCWAVVATLVVSVIRSPDAR